MLIASANIVDLSEGVTGPFAGRILADLGASVIKVEDVSKPDGLRSMPARENARNPLFDVVNSGKKLAVCDLKQPVHRDRLELFLSQADIAILSEKTADDVRELAEAAARSRPTLVILDVSAFGRTEPMVAHSDLTVQHQSGFAYHQARPVHELARRRPVSGADHEGQLAAAVAAALAALWAMAVRDAGGKAPVVDFAECDFYAQLLIDSLSEWNAGERRFDRGRSGNASTEVAGGLIWLLPSADGWVLISPREQHQWDRWMSVLGNPEWASDPALCGTRDVRKENWSAIRDRMGAWTSLHLKSDIFEKGQAAKVPCFPLSTPADLLANDQLAARRFFNRLRLENGTEASVAGLPFALRTTDGRSLEKMLELAAPALQRIDDLDPATCFSFKRGPTGRQGASNSQRPLEGKVVIDFSWVVAGPMATKMMAAMGAEVIKIESAQRPEFRKRDGYFHILNAGKRSCAINIASPDGQHLIRSLAAKADVVIENFSAGVLDRLGIGYADLSAVKPDLIFCTASGMGREGPLRDTLAYGTLLQAFSGRAALVGDVNQYLEAMGIIPAWTDPVTAMWETAAILAALHNRQETGQGAYIDVSMLESTLALLPASLLAESLPDLPPAPRGNFEPDAAPSGCFACRGKDEWLAVSVRTDVEWRGFCLAIGLDTLATDPRYRTQSGRVAGAAELNTVAETRLAAMDPDEAEISLRSAGVPAARSRSIVAQIETQRARRRGIFAPMPDGSLVPTLPWMDGNGWRGVFGQTPTLGQDTEAILGSKLGISKRDMDCLRKNGSIG